MVTYLVPGDEAVILAESLKLVLPLDALHEATQPLGLQVSRASTKKQASGRYSY